MKNTNRTIVITGASSGIGKVTAEYLAKKGYKVYGLSRRGVPSNIFTALSCDVTDNVAFEQVIKNIYKKEGEIFCLINNAGTGISGAVEHIPCEKTIKLMQVNLQAVMECSRIVIPYLKKSHGKIINVSSVAAVVPIPFQTAYSVSKAGVNMFTQALRLELKNSGIRVCAVMPGDTKTGFTDAREKIECDKGYENNLYRSVSRMEKDEQNGKNPVSVAKAINKLLQKNNPPAVTIVGFSYKAVVFLAKILPQRLMAFIVGKLYG